jgi:hypothetical protein
MAQLQVSPIPIEAVPIIFALVGAVFFAFAIFLILRASRVAKPFHDAIGAWVTPAVRGLGVLLALVSAIFVLFGLANIFAPL